jgi:hypothetical protein
VSIDPSDVLMSPPIGRSWRRVPGAPRRSGGPGGSPGGSRRRRPPEPASAARIGGKGRP